MRTSPLNDLAFIPLHRAEGMPRKMDKMMMMTTSTTGMTLSIDLHLVAPGGCLYRNLVSLQIPEDVWIFANGCNTGKVY